MSSRSIVGERRPDGKAFTPQRWSTPISGYQSFGTRRIGSTGVACWCPVDEGNDFDYVELFVDDITYDESAPQTTSARSPVRGAHELA